MSRRSGGRLAPYTSSGVARFTNMLLSLWLSPWGKLIDLEVFVPSVPLLSLKGIHLAVFTAQKRRRPCGTKRSPHFSHRWVIAWPLSLLNGVFVMPAPLALALCQRAFEA